MYPCKPALNQVPGTDRIKEADAAHISRGHPHILPPTHHPTQMKLEQKIAAIPHLANAVLLETERDMRKTWREAITAGGLHLGAGRRQPWSSG